MANITLREFLKRYTAISTKFIDKYMKFYDMCQNKLYGIYLEDVIKYLKIKMKKIFYENFRKKYKVNKDYVVIRLKTKSKKNVRNARYYISFDTFERICMSTKAKKGNEVRDYFILLRKFIDYYKSNISDMIMKNMTNKKYKFMYIILVNKNKNIFKTGRSKNMRTRLNNYFTGKDSHPDIKFIMMVNDPLTVENCSKLFLKNYKTKGNKELYKVDINVIKEVIFDCAHMDRKFNKNKKEFKKLTKNKKKNYDAFVVYDEKAKTVEYLDENNKVIGYEKRKKSMKGGGGTSYYNKYNQNKLHYQILKEFMSQ